MDEEGVRQPSGPPTRKKFFIPLDEDEAPPAGVGQRRRWGERWQAGVGGGGGLRGRGLQGPWCGLGNVVAWVTLGKQSFALRESASLSVRCHGGSKTGLWQRLQTQAAGCVLCGQPPGLQRMNLLLTLENWKALQLKGKVGTFDLSW